MYIVGDIAYASTPVEQMQIVAVKPLSDMMMILTFASGEKRLYDASGLLAYPAFAPLSNQETFQNASIDHGVVTWSNGDIDIAPETMYQNSYPYNDIAI